MIDTGSDRVHAGDVANSAEQVIVLAPLGRDAKVVCDALNGSGIACVAADGISTAIDGIRQGAAVLLVTEEGLTVAGVASMKTALAGQPSWSDLPVLLLLAEGERFATEAARTVEALRTTANVTVLVRPVPAVALVTAVQSALRARKRQYEVRDLLRREQAARLEAEQANRLKDEFLANVSHELRTPLSAIMLWSGLLASGRVRPGKAADALGAIQHSAEAQSRLIEDLLDVSRLVNGKLDLQTQSIELSPVIRRAISAVALMAEAKKIDLGASLAQDIGNVYADGDRLQQVIWNLLGNAIKFTPAGGRVSIDLRPERHAAVIRITDTGQGIASEFLPHIFERFRQADAASTRRHGGLGLGLSIARHLVELHGGSIAVDSDGLGKGSTFTVRLPLTDAAATNDLPERHVACTSSPSPSTITYAYQPKTSV